MEALVIVLMGAVNFLSVMFAVWFLHWREQARKKMLANVFLQALGEQMKTEEDFQRIVKNLKIDLNDDEDESGEKK
jgi:hypothetical protein